MAEKEFIVPAEDIGVDGAYFGYTELIRCIDCRHWCEEDHVCGLRDCYGWDYKPDSFCSWAERRQK